MPLDFNQLRELLTAIAQTDIAELTLKSADFELTVRKGIPSMPAIAPSVSSPGSAPAAFVAPPPEAAAMAPVAPSGSTVPRDTAPPAPPPAIDQKWKEILSPMVGTFYRAAGPDESPFVEVGDRIRSGQTVCIIEAMKLMNEIESEVSGQVMEILVQNGEPVEFDQPLMRINPG
ncbi:MAG: acetyl-CoA carboxylase biotin carboxyl carrier protein [Cyanobacteriota bacterium]